MKGCEEALLILEMDRLGFDPVYSRDLIQDYAFRLLQKGVDNKDATNLLQSNGQLQPIRLWP